jgi:hypothetical protein
VEARAVRAWEPSGVRLAFSWERRDASEGWWTTYRCELGARSTILGWTAAVIPRLAPSMLLFLRAGLRLVLRRLARLPWTALAALSRSPHCARRLALSGRSICTTAMSQCVPNLVLVRVAVELSKARRDRTA